MRLLIRITIALALLVAPAAADHGTPFPLVSHSLNAKLGTDLEAGQGICQGQPVMLVRFNLAGRHWVFAYVENDQRWLFIEFDPKIENPVRVWVGHGADDLIVPDRHIDNPTETVPAGPCSLLYPPSASERLPYRHAEAH